jgi:hypothetical protein
MHHNFMLSRITGLVLVCGIFSAVSGIAGNLYVANANFEFGLAAPYASTPSYTPVIDPFFVGDPMFNSDNSTCSGGLLPCGPYNIGNYDGGTVSALPDWTVNSLAGFFAPIFYTSPVFPTPPPGGGDYYAFAEADGTISQEITSETILAGVTYTLDVYVGYPDNLGLGAPDPHVLLDIGGTLVAVGATTGTLTEGTFVLYTATYTGTALTAGENLTIDLGNTSGTAMFSNVTLTDPIPEPASFSMLALGIGLLGAAVYARSVTRFNV